MTTSPKPRPTPERDIQALVRLAAGPAGYTLWRNNVGTAWTGSEVIELADGSIRITNPRRLHAGLCEGSSDLIGLHRTIITPEHVGTTIARFTAVECKTATGKPTAKQRHFLEFVTDAGGIGIVARGPEDLSAALEPAP